MQLRKLLARANVAFRCYGTITRRASMVTSEIMGCAVVTIDFDASSSWLASI
jgi:hypothetical protein